MKKLNLCLILSLLLIFASAPVTAQNSHSADDLALIDYVQSVLDNFADEGSFRITGSQNITQTLSANIDGTKWIVDQTIDQIMNGSLQYGDADSVAAEMDIDQVMVSAVPGQAEIEMTQEMGVVVVDDTLYMRVGRVSPEEIAAMFPQGWVNVSENPNAIPGASMIDAEAYVGIFNTPFAYTLSAESVTSISELPEEEIDGETLRVFEMTLDLNTLFEDGQLDQLMGAFDMSAMGVNMDDLMAQMLEKATITMTTWVTADDVIYRVDSEMRFASIVTDLVPGLDETAIDQIVRTSFIYSDYGVDFDITAPAGEA